MVAGDFWLNIYADSLNVGADLLTGTGLSRYVALRRIVETAETVWREVIDFVIVDLPPSFGSLVRAAFYSSEYFIVPCTSDNFSVYCVGLIGQMVPSFINDWNSGLARFKLANPQFTDFDALGQPKFAGWVFNGFDTARRRRSPNQIAAGVPVQNKIMIQADATMHGRLSAAISNDLVGNLLTQITSYAPVANGLPVNFQIGDIEDANNLVQNSLWLRVPIGQLHNHQQVVSIQDRTGWAANQLESIQIIGDKFDQMAQIVQSVCV